MSIVDKHILYEAAVQTCNIDVEFFNRTFKRIRGKKPLSLREDFSGTALLCREWASQSAKHKAIGVELDPEVIAWAEENRQVPGVEFIQADVCTVDAPKVDLISGFNFSYCIFKERAKLKSYFQNAYDGLNESGLFVVDVYAGPAAQNVLKEDREIPKGRDVNGIGYPRFKYYWEQASYNFVNNHTVCHIHFKPKGEKKMKQVFTYDWRLWSLTEVRDLLLEVGFSDVEINIEGWDEETEDTDGVFVPQTLYEDMESFIAYVVAIR